MADIVPAADHDSDPVADAEADAEEKEDFRRFLDRTSPAELIRHLQRARPEPPTAGEEVDSEADSAPESEPEEGEGEGEGGPA